MKISGQQVSMAQASVKLKLSCAVVDCHNVLHWLRVFTYLKVSKVKRGNKMVWTANQWNL